MEPEGVSRKGSGGLRGPLATSLLLHAALLGLLALALPRALPGLGATVEVRLVSLESEEGAGGGEGGGITAGAPTGGGQPLARAPAVVGRTAGPRAREAQQGRVPSEPVVSAAPSVEPTAGEPPRAGPEPPAAPATPAAPVPAATPPGPLPAPPPAPSAEARASSGGPLAVEGPKAAAPDLSLATPSGFGVPQDSPATGAALPGQAPAAAGGSAGPEGETAAPVGGGLAREGGGGAPGIGGAFARAKDGGPGTGGGTAGLGGGTGTGGLGAGTGRDGAFAYILKRIEAAKRYPEEARRLGHRGTVAVRFRIGPDGAVAAAEVAASSGFSLLDAASLETVRRAAPLPAVPGWLRVRISYGLAEARP
jgi:TonB family protein